MPSYQNSLRRRKILKQLMQMKDIETVNADERY